MRTIGAPPAGRDLDADLEVSRAALVPVRNLDDDAASHDARVDAFQPMHSLPDVRFDVVTVRETVEGHLRGNESHGPLVCSCRMTHSWESPAAGIH